MDTAQANALTAEWNAAFAAIGLTAAGTTASCASQARATEHAKKGLPPRGKKNTEPVAYEYHVASHLARIAEARKTAAAKAAVIAGVMFDPRKEPLEVGSNTLVYAGQIVEISVAVTTPATRLDVLPLLNDLEKAGVKRALLDKLVAAHTLTNAAPHKFSSTLVTD